MFHAGTKTCQQPVLSKLCTSTFAYVTNTETTQNVAFRQRGACRACKTARDPFKGHKYGGFLAPFFGSPADCNWITVSGGDIFYLDKAFRGSAPEPGIWNFGNLTGESNYVGVVKNAFKGSRLDIRWVDNSGETLCRDNCQLIGMPFFILAGQAKNH